MKKKSFLIVAPLILLSLTGCNPDQVTKLEVNSVKEIYYIGQTFDKSQLNVIATLKSGVVKDLTPEEYTLSPESYTFKDADKDKQIVFTVTYGGRTTIHSVVPKEPELCSINVTPKETSYYVTDTFTKDSIKVEGTYSDESTKEIAQSEYTMEPASHTFTQEDMSKGKDFTIKCKTFEKTINIKPIEKILVAYISITSESTQIATGNKVEITAAVYPQDASIKKLKWTIENLQEGGPFVEIIEENDKVYVKGIKQGSAKIEAESTDGGQVVSNQLTFTVADPIPVSSVTISNTTKQVSIDGKLELTASVLPENATNKNLTWSIVSGGDGSGTIETEGGKTYLKGVSVGTVKVQAEATDGSGVKSSVVDFTVKEGGKLVTKITITNDYRNVPLCSGAVPLTAKVEPEDAENKEIDWEIVGGTSTATIMNSGNNKIIYGRSEGTVQVRAKAKDGSDVKSDVVEFQVSNILYTITEGTNVSANAYTIWIHTQATKNTVIDIPDELDGSLVKNGVPGTKYHVTTLPDDAFPFAWLTSIKLPSTLKKIGARAFYQNSYPSEVTSLTLNEGLEEIGDQAFKSFIKITTVTLPSTLQILGNKAFENGTISSITFPKSLVSIGARPFGDNQYDGRGLKALTNVTFLDTTSSWTYGASGSEKTFQPSTSSTENAKWFKVLDNTTYGLKKNVQ